MTTATEKVYETIEVETADHVRIITLNRPDTYNAFNDQLTTELADALIACSPEPHWDTRRAAGWWAFLSVRRNGVYGSWRCEWRAVMIGECSIKMAARLSGSRDHHLCSLRRGRH